MDRNFRELSCLAPILVALREEGVDRNFMTSFRIWLSIVSPSVRRAWIEISYGPGRPGLADVALREEGVDRNYFYKSEKKGGVASPSVRRAWIEIVSHNHSSLSSPSPSVRRAWIEIRELVASLGCEDVALREEGVDRNYTLLVRLVSTHKSPSVRRAWIEIELGGAQLQHVRRRPPRGGRG